MLKHEILSGMEDVTRRHGPWLGDIPLAHGIRTLGGTGLPHTRLKRIVQIIADTVGKPLAECRILDLGCLEGFFSVEIALQGAEAVGIEVREANVEKARFAQRALDLPNLVFHKDDARNISVGKYGHFDAIICSGILYHLRAAEAIALVDAMYDMSGLVIIDTHISFTPEHRHGDYWGRIQVEHSSTETPADREKKLLHSADNETSFHFTRPSLVNILSEAGFSSVYECFTPAHLNFGRPGLESRDRCTFVAIKGEAVNLIASPAANGLQERFPEGSLSYAPRPITARIVGRAKRLLGLA